MPQDTTCSGSLRQMDTPFTVFSEADFEAIYTSFDVPAGELAYVYEIGNTGSDTVSSAAISPLDASFSSIGNDATLGGVAPVSEFLFPAISALWDYSGANILQGSSSTALVLTSPLQPGGLTNFTIVNGGGSAVVQVVATIPEPFSFVVWAGVSASVLVMTRRRRPN